MKFLSILAGLLMLTSSLMPMDAEAARRLGGGGSSGMQRQMSTPPAASKPTQAAPAPTTPPSAASAPQAQPKRSWMGPLAGLAAGIGLAALASHFGFGDELASMMMIGLLVMAVVMVVGMVMRRRQTPTPAMAGNTGGMAYTGQNSVEPEPYSPRSAAPVIGAGLGAGVGQGLAQDAAAAAIPADFDAVGFVHNAKQQFVRLQAANDNKDLVFIQEMTTQELFLDFKAAIDARGTEAQRTEVTALEGEVLEVQEEAQRYIVSVRFYGRIREQQFGPDESLDEIWHLVKSKDGRSGWLLAGIQQV